MFEGFESFIESKLEETAQKEFIINNREPLPCERVHGIELDNGFFVYNNGSYMNWCLCDINSGTLIQGHFNTLAEVKDFVINMDPEFMERINNARNTEKYKLACEKISNEKDVAEEAFNSYSLKETLDILNACPINTLVEDYQPITEKTTEEKTKASKTFWNYANADRYGREIVFDLGNFHIAYDEDMVRLNLLDVFTDDGKLKDKTIWDRIKQADDNSYAIKALSKVAKMQFSMGMYTKEEVSAIKKAKAEQEKEYQEWRDKLNLQKSKLIAERTAELQAKIPDIQQEVFNNLNKDLLVKISKYTGNGIKLKPEDILLDYEVTYYQNGDRENATFDEYISVYIKLMLNGRQSNKGAQLLRQDATNIVEITDTVNKLLENFIDYLETIIYDKIINNLYNATFESHLLGEYAKGYQLFYKINNILYKLVRGGDFIKAKWKLINMSTKEPVKLEELNTLVFNKGSQSNLVAIKVSVCSETGRCYSKEKAEYAWNEKKITDDDKKLIGIALKEEHNACYNITFSSADGVYARLGLTHKEDYEYECDSSD